MLEIYFLKGKGTNKFLNFLHFYAGFSFFMRIDALGNQTKVSKLDGTEVARHEYDENGLRTKKIMGDQTKEYEYDGNSHNLVLEMT